MYQPNDGNFDPDFKCHIENQYDGILGKCQDNDQQLPGGIITEQEITDALKGLKQKGGRF